MCFNSENVYFGKLRSEMSMQILIETQPHRPSTLYTDKFFESVKKKNPASGMY